MQNNPSDLSDNYSVMTMIITKVYVNYDVRSLPVFTWLENMNDLSTLPVYEIHNVNTFPV